MSEVFSIIGFNESDKKPSHKDDYLTARLRDFNKIKSEVDSYVYSLSPTTSNSYRELCVRDIVLTNGSVHCYRGYNYFIPYNNYFDPRAYVVNYCVYTLSRLLRLPLNILLEYPGNIIIPTKTIPYYSYSVKLSMFLRYMIGAISCNSCYAIATDSSVPLTDVYDYDKNYFPEELKTELKQYILLHTNGKSMMTIEVSNLLKDSLRNYRLNFYEKWFIKYMLTHLTEIPLSMIKVNIENRIKTFKFSDPLEPGIIIEDLYQALAIYFVSNLTAEEKVLVRRALKLLKFIFIIEE